MHACVKMDDRSVFLVSTVEVNYMEQVTSVDTCHVRVAVACAHFFVLKQCPVTAKRCSTMWVALMEPSQMIFISSLQPAWKDQR